MEVSNRENEDQIILKNINDSVWKTTDETSSSSLVEFGPGLRELLDTIYCEKDFP